MKLRGWLFDIYPAGQDGAAIWLIGEDGKRYQFLQPFPLTFYAAGPLHRLRDLWRFLSRQDKPPMLSRTERRDLFQSGPIPVMGITVGDQESLQGIFLKTQSSFPDLDYYDVDLNLALRYSARYQTFPLALCDLETEGRQIKAVTPLETPWEMDSALPPLRILRLEPDSDPNHSQPARLEIQYGRASYTLPLDPARPLLMDLNAILKQYDPDLILTRWGDTWLMPHLFKLSRDANIPILFNRDRSQEVAILDERSYFSYGQIVYRGQQVHFFGRWHIDSNNALLYQDFELDGIYETARVTRLPVQTSARVSPGTGISSMQIITALQQGILVPWRKQQGERFKTALDLIHRDQGGLVYQPLVGVHENVAELDFVSMYPGLMVRFNISPETAGETAGDPENLAPFPGDTPGLVPQTLAPLLEKRLKLKTRIRTLSKWDIRLKSDQARATAHKWLLVTCFGYLGYKNARFGRIEAHEAVTAYGREALLRAKESAEGLDCTVLQLYVDGLWIKHAGWKNPGDFVPVLDAIIGNTRLPIVLEGVYRWIAFLPSRQDQRVPVPNRYFGVFQDGTIKVRGVEARRRDTAQFISRAQMEILEILARAQNAIELPNYLPLVKELIRERSMDLKAGRIPLEDLIISQRLGRELEGYKKPSPAARAAHQLIQTGKQVKPGQRVRFLLTRGLPGVHAWDSQVPLDMRSLNIPLYSELLKRAIHAILQPLGLSQHAIFQASLFK